MNSTALGLIAGALTTGAWLPQIIRTWKLRRAEEISWGYLGVFGIGIVCWLIYGLIKSDLAIILANAVTLVLVGLLGALKVLTARATPVLASDGSPG